MLGTLGSFSFFLSYCLSFCCQLKVMEWNLALLLSGGLPAQERHVSALFSMLDILLNVFSHNKVTTA